MVVVLMGVTGSGKTTVGKLLANDMGWNFYDADDFHPEENVEKMRNGVPLNDEDRMPWLDALSTLIASSEAKHMSLVLACSALKHSYRKILRKGSRNVKFFYLKGSPELIKTRLEARKGHYMNPSLLTSQFNTLEEPKDAQYIDISPEPPVIKDSIKLALGL